MIPGVMRRGAECQGGLVAWVMRLGHRCHVVMQGIMMWCVMMQGVMMQVIVNAMRCS